MAPLRIGLLGIAPAGDPIKERLSPVGAKEPLGWESWERASSVQAIVSLAAPSVVSELHGECPTGTPVQPSPRCSVAKSLTEHNSKRAHPGGTPGRGWHHRLKFPEFAALRWVVRLQQPL